MAGTSSETVESVELVVKNPYTHKTFSCSVDTNTTVLEVKKLLEESYSGRPKPSKQRLVFYGKIHSDESSLATIFKGQDLTRPQTCHLIISGASQDPLPKPKIEKSKDEQAQVLPTQPAQPAAPPRNSPTMRQNEPQEDLRRTQINREPSGLLDHMQNQSVLFQQQLYNTATMATASGIHGLSLESQLNFNTVTSSLGGVLSGASFEEKGAQAKNGAKETMQVAEDMHASSMRQTAQRLSIEKEIERLDKAYEQLVRTIQLSQQFQALSNPLLLAPQPIWHSQAVSASQGLNSTQNVSETHIRQPVAQAHGGVDPQQRPAVQNAGPQEGGDPRPENNVRVVRRVYVINVRLILKLLFLIYIVGNDANYNKLLWFGLLAALYYCYEMGFFRRVLGSEMTLTSLATRFGGERLVQIPPAEGYSGFFVDAQTLIKTLVLSLVPSWHVEPYAQDEQETQSEAQDEAPAVAVGGE